MKPNKVAASASQGHFDPDTRLAVKNLQSVRKGVHLLVVS